MFHTSKGERDMKYIRTKNGIYERIMVVRQVCDGKEVAVIKPDKVEFEPILKQADTIEELCDGFVIVGINNDFYEDDFHKVYQDFIYARHVMVSLEKESHYERDFIIYGAIWTDKGLQFVARMNSEGALELL